MWSKVLKILNIENKKTRKRFLILYSSCLVLIALVYFFVSEHYARLLGCSVAGSLITWILIRPEIWSDKQNEQK